MAMIRCPLNESAHISMNESGIITADGALLFTETEMCVVATAELLAGKGVRAGDRVGLLVNEGWEQVVLFWALLRIGAAACPLAGLDSMELKAAAAAAAGIKWIVQDGTCAAPVPVPTLSMNELVGFTGLFKKEHRPHLELQRAAVVLPCVGADGALSLVTHTVGSCYYAALAGNATLPLRSSSKHHWALEPLYTFRGIDTLFRCAVAGATVAAGMSRPPELSEINALDVTHITVARDEVDAFLKQLDGTETELTHVLVHGNIVTETFSALKKKELFVVMTLGTAETGYFAVVDHQHCIHPMRYTQIKTDDQYRLLAGGKTLANEVPGGWMVTDIRCRADGDRLFIAAR